MDVERRRMPKRTKNGAIMKPDKVEITADKEIQWLLSAMSRHCPKF